MTDAPHQWRSLPLEEIISSLIMFPTLLSWTYSFIVSCWRRRWISLICNTSAISFRIHINLQNLIYPLHIYRIPRWFEALEHLSIMIPVIFDSGTSLSISPSHVEFIGSITPIPDLCIAGIENGMIIESKLIIEWYFWVLNHKILLNMSATMFLTAKFIIIGPQRLLNISSSITGEIYFNKDHDQLKIRGYPVLTSYYYHSNCLQCFNLLARYKSLYHLRIKSKSVSCYKTFLIMELSISTP